MKANDLRKIAAYRASLPQDEKAAFDKLLKTTNDTDLVRQTSQKFRSPARLATAAEVKTGRPQRYSSRRQRINADELIARGNKIFGGAI